MKLEIKNSIYYGDTLYKEDITEIKYYPNIEVKNINDIDINKNEKFYFIFIINTMNENNIYNVLIDKYNYQLNIKPNTRGYKFGTNLDDSKKVVIEVDLNVDTDVKKINTYCTGITNSILIYHNKQWFEHNEYLSSFSLPALYKVKNKWFIDDKVINNINIKQTVSNYMKDGFLI